MIRTNTKRILLTGAGGAATLEIIRSLQRTSRYELIGADAYRYSAGFPLLCRGYVVPFGASPEFSGAMRKLLDLERPDAVVPLVDEEIPVVHALVSGHFPGTVVIAPRLEFCTQAMDKWAMAEAMRLAGLATARTWLASGARDWPYPAVIKPRTGRGSRGLASLERPEDFENYLRKASRGADQYVVQERLSGVEFTTSVVVTLDGRLLAVVPKEAVEKRGITRVGITRVVPAIDELCAGIQERLQANGPFNVQLVLDKDGIPKVFEVNPRYSTTTALTIAAGIDEVDAVIRSAFGEKVEPLHYRPGVMMIRHETQFFTDELAWSPRQADKL